MGKAKELSKDLREKVDVSSSSQWRVGVLAHGLPLEQAQWVLWLFNNVLAAQAPGTPLSMLRDQQPPRRLKLTLDCDAGQLSFNNPQTHAHIHSLKFEPGLKMFPYVKTWDAASIRCAGVYVTVDSSRSFERNKGSNLLRMLDNVSARKKNINEIISNGARRRELREEDEIEIEKRKIKERNKEMEAKALKHFHSELERSEYFESGLQKSEKHYREFESSAMDEDERAVTDLGREREKRMSRGSSRSLHRWEVKAQRSSLTQQSTELEDVDSDSKEFCI